MSSVVVLSPPQVNMLETVNYVDMGVTPRSACIRPCAESSCDNPPLKKLKKARTRRKKAKFKKRCLTKVCYPVAPFNSTQFLMAEHDQLTDSDLEASKPKRHRDSSLSMESELDDGEDLAMPEDEEFLTKEFWAAYEDVHAERLDNMSHNKLVQEYLSLEEKVEILERQLRIVRARQRRRKLTGMAADAEDDDEDIRPGEVKVDSETAEKISVFKQEITNLEEENRKLREENDLLKVNASSDSSSNSSSSSSSDSGSSSDSDSDDDDGQERSYEVSVTAVDQDLSSKLAVEVPLLCTPMDSGVSCGCGSSSSSEDLVTRLEELDGEKCDSESHRLSDQQPSAASVNS